MNSSKSSLFLMELILSILFFSLASAVCVQLFVKSHLISRQSTDLTNSVNLAQDVAEIYTGVLDCDNYLDKKPLFDSICRIINESGVLIYSDTKEDTLVLKSLNEEEYVVNFIYKGYSADTGLCESKIEVYAGSPKESTVYSDIEPIYSLEVNRHLPERKE